MAARTGPCFVLSLKQAVYVLLSIDVIWSLNYVVLYGITLVVSLIDDPNLTLRGRWTRSDLLTLSALLTASSFIKIGLAVLLLFAAYRRSRVACLVWLSGNLVFLIMTVFGMVLEVPGSSNSSPLVFGLIAVVYNLYEMVVVYWFLDWCKEQKDGGGGCGNATASAPELDIGRPSKYTVKT